MVGWVSSVNQRAAASMSRVNEFMDIKSEIVNTNFDNYP
jgi:ATP-binding cassette subfamily B protein